jgi:hypothetical protein
VAALCAERIGAVGTIVAGRVVPMVSEEPVELVVDAAF